MKELAYCQSLPMRHAAHTSTGSVLPGLFSEQALGISLKPSVCSPAGVVQGGGGAACGRERRPFQKSLWVLLGTLLSSSN